ncbi:hypothetical protein BDY24DRAFT_351224 [Mrakia frigida]|uniref:uncharacterized protein n=1 Tax=Mrakia frigida TaxID=29902 RepID=UPI003FCC10A7
MLILPKVPHSLRTLTQSFARSLNPSSGGAAQPSVTFSSQGSSVHVIGGGGPFTHNSALLGGGALTRTGGGASPGTGIGFENWAPASGGGGGAGAGSRNAGAGSYGGYTGHARALIQSTPSASTDPTSLLDDDDAELQTTLSSHRLRVRQLKPSPPPHPRPDRSILRPQNDEQLKIVRRESIRLPEVQRRLRLAFAAKAAAREELLEQEAEISNARRIEAARMLELEQEEAAVMVVEAVAVEAKEEVVPEEEAEDRVVDKRGRLRLSSMEKRERGRSITPSPLIFLASSSSKSSTFGKEVLPSSARSISHQSTRRYSASSAEEVNVARPESDPSLDHLLLSPRGSPTKKEFSSENPFTSIPSLDSILSPPSDELLLSSASEPVEQQNLDSESLTYDDFDFDTLGSVNASDLVALPVAEPTTLSSSSPPINSLDAERRASLEGALQTRDVSIVLREVSKYTDLAPSGVEENGIQLPQQTTKTYNVALRAMCSIRPPGAPVSEIIKVYSGMVAKNVAPDVETYSIVIRVLCEREVEIQEAFAFEKELRRVPLLASHSRSFRAPPNLLPLPSLHTFVNTPDFTSLKEERNLDQAISLFTAASSFRLISTHPFPIEAYDALLKACAKSARAQDALRIFVDLEEKVGKEGGVVGTTFRTWQSMVEVYGRQGAMDASEDVFEEYKEAEMDGGIVIREGRERHIDSERIFVWNSLVDAYFKNGNPLRAVEIVESLTAPSEAAVSVPGLLPLPAIHASTLTSVIQGFIQTDDLDSALSWFKRIVPEGDHPAPTGLPPLEPIAFVSLLSIASRIRDHDMYDLIFDRFTAHPPQGYHFRPVELAEAIHLHLAATENPTLSPEQKNYHLDRIFHFVERCDRHERSKYLYPPSIAGSLLRLLIEQNRSEAIPDVYSRALRSGQENETDPLAAIKFHAYFFESVVHWLTTPTQNPLNLSIVERLRLVATLVKIADAVDVPTDLTTSELAPRILHLYLQAKREVNGDLRLLELDNNFVTMIMHAAGLDDLNLLKDPETAHLAAASATFVHDIVELQHATEARFNVDWTFGARAVVACQGVETAIEVLRPLGEEVLYLSGAVPRPSIGRFSRLNPDVPSFVPSNGSVVEPGFDEEPTQQATASSVEQSPADQDASASNPLPPSSEYESTAVSNLDASEYEQSQTSISTSVPTSDVPATLSSKLLFDANLSELVDLHHRSDSKVSPLQSFAVLQDGITRGYTPSVSVLGHLITALGRLKEMDKVNELLELAHNVLYATDRKDLKAWFSLESSAIVAFAHCGEMDRANFHRHNIIQNGGKPTPDAYAAIINGAKDTTDDASIARELFQEALSVGTKPHLFLYNTVISSLSKARKAEEALALFYAMQDGKIKPNTVSYGAVINGCCRVGDIDTASRLFIEMTEQPTFKARVPPYNTMMQYYTTAQPDRSRVLFYYDELVNAGVQPSSHTYNLLMLAYGTIEPIDLNAMEKVFSILRKRTSGETTVQGLHYATLINCHGAVARDLEKALQIFDSIAVASQPPKKDGSRTLPDAVCWEAILNVILVHKRFDLFESYTQRMHEFGTPSTTYIQNVLIKAYSAEGKIEKAREVFEAMENPRMGVAAPHSHEGEAKEDGKVYHQPSSYEAMIRAELGAGNRDRAADLCNMMEGRMYPLSVTSRIRSILGEADAGIISPPASAWSSSA